MSFAFRRLAATSLVGFLALACARPAQGQPAGRDLIDQRIEALTIKEPSINRALSVIASEYRIPIGLEMAPKEKSSSPKPIELSVESATLREVLDAVVRQDDAYAWRVADGVVNVYPARERDHLLKDLLATRVHRFSIDNNPSLYKIRNSIVRMPEIKSKLDGARVTPHVVAYTGVDFARLGQGFSLDLSAVTLQALLNHIIRESEAKFWVLNRTGEENELLILNF